VSVRLLVGASGCLPGAPLSSAPSFSSMLKTLALRAGCFSGSVRGASFLPGCGPWQRSTSSLGRLEREESDAYDARSRGWAKEAMTMQCFCGCGRKVSLRARRPNKSGRSLRRDMRRIEDLVDAGLVSPNAATFLAQAKEWCDGFLAAVHLGIRPDDEAPGFYGTYLGWLREVRPFVGQVGVGYLGKQVRDSRLDRDTAVSLMRSGQWDPYESVHMPVPNPTEPS